MQGAASALVTPLFLCRHLTGARLKGRAARCAEACAKMMDPCTPMSCKTCMSDWLSTTHACSAQRTQTRAAVAATNAQSD